MSERKLRARQIEQLEEAAAQMSRDGQRLLELGAEIARLRGLLDGLTTAAKQMIQADEGAEDWRGLENALAAIEAETGEGSTPMRSAPMPEVMEILAPKLSPDAFDAVEAAVKELPADVAERLVNAVDVLAVAANRWYRQDYSPVEQEGSDGK